MTMDEALAVRMPFGMHRELTLEQIADRDVLYLDWLVDRKGLTSTLREAIEVVHADYADEIEEELRSRDGS